MTKQEYAEYEERVARYLQGIENLSTGPCASCEECQNERGHTEEEMETENELREDPWFSWNTCEVCGDIAGNRVTWHGWIPPTNQPGCVHEHGKIVHGTCCTDCEYYLAYGQLDDTNSGFSSGHDDLADWQVDMGNVKVTMKASELCQPTV